MGLLDGIGKLVGGAGGKAAGQTGVGKLIGNLGGIGGLISIGSSLAGLLGGNKQKKQGKKMLAGLKDPGYVIPEEFNKNLGIAENMARTGLPSQEYNLASTNIQRGTQAGLRQLGRMSNPFAGIAGLARSQSDAFSRLDASNAAARRQNLLGAMGARRELAGQKLNQQQYNQRRYEEAVNEANAMIGAGQQNKAGSLGALGQYGAMLGLYGGGQGRGNDNRPETDATKSTSLVTNQSLDSFKFNPSDPLGLGQFLNPNQGLGRVAGRKFAGYGGPLGIGGGYYNPNQD